MFRHNATRVVDRSGDSAKPRLMQALALPSHAASPYGTYLSALLITGFGFHFHTAHRAKWGCFMDKLDRSLSKINIQFEIRTEQATKLF